MKSVKDFPETKLAADLLRKFFMKTAAEASGEALQSTVVTFFDKQYLTMSEFLAPIGLDIRTAKNTSLKGTVADFFGAGLHKVVASSTMPPKVETIRQFLSRL